MKKRPDSGPEPSRPRKRKPKPPPPPPIPIQEPPPSGVAQHDLSTALRPIAGATRLGELHAVRRSWLWEPIIPIGVVTVVTGPQGCGKTALLAAAACEATATGVLSGDSRPHAGTVIWYSHEDDAQTVLHPRLQGAGCRLNDVHVPDYAPDGRVCRRTTLPGDATAIADLCHQLGAILVVFDPLTSFMATGMSPNDALQVRAVMDSLGELAARAQVAILATLHPRKQRSGSPLDWVSGSAAWTQAARQVILVDHHPDRRGEYLLSTIKRCSGHRSPSRCYTLDMTLGVPVFTLGEDSDLDPREIGELGDLGELAERADALEWLRSELSEQREVRALYRRWQEQGYGRTLWWRARRKLGCKVRRIGTQTEQTTWLYLPTDADP